MRKWPLTLLPLLLLLTACGKEPGEGGRSEITGRVMAQNYNTQGVAIFDPYPFPEHRVYIIYGDGQYHDDDVRTGADGRFRFNGLRKGRYTIYTISQKARTADDPSGTFAVSRTIEVGANEGVDLGDLQIQRHRGWN